MTTFRTSSKRRVLTAASCLVIALAAQSAFADVLIPKGSAWKYWAGEDSLPNAWKNTAYDDSRWPNGNAQLGYGDGDEATVVHGADLQIYFRKRLVLDTFTYKNVVGKVVADDGAVVYVNGQEVGRVNMPAGDVPFGTKALVGISGADEDAEHAMNINGNLLTIGENVIAVSVHNSKSTSSDMSFDFILTGDKNPTPSPSPSSLFDNEVIPRQSTWKYHDSTGNLDGTTWNALGFDDSAWASGAGEFGYGDGQNTVIARNGIVAYFRTEFAITNKAQVTGGKISVRRDDGCICYLNGNEILRSNLPDGDVTSATTANNGVSGVSEQQYQAVETFDKSNFVEGTNLLACSVHQNDAGSSDLTFDGQVWAVTDLTIQVSPSPTSSPPPGSSASNSPAPADPSPSSSPAPPSSTATATASPAPPTPTATATATPAFFGGQICTGCSCGCASLCAANDPILSTCSGGGSSSSSNTGIIVAACVVIGICAIAGAGFLYYRHTKQQEAAKAGKAGAGAGAAGKGKGGAAADTANPMLMDQAPDLEAGDGAAPATPAAEDRKHRSSRDKNGERKHRSSRDKDGERKHRSSKDKDGTERKHRSSSKDKDGAERKHRSSRDKDGAERKHRSSSKDKDGAERKHRSSSKDKHRSSRDKDGAERKHRSSSKDKHRSSSKH